MIAVVIGQWLLFLALLIPGLIALFDNNIGPGIGFAVLALLFAPFDLCPPTKGT